MMVWIILALLGVVGGLKLHYAHWREPLIGDTELCYVLDFFNPVQFGKTRTIVYSMHVLTIRRYNCVFCSPRNRRCVINTWYQLNAASKNVLKANTLTFKGAFK